MSKIRKFNAVCVNCYEEDDVLIIGVGDNTHDPKNFVIIGRFDEGETPVNQCIGFQSDTTDYEIADAIKSVHLSVKELVIVLNDDAAKEVGIKEYHVTISTEKDTTLLKQYLGDVFDSSDVALQLP